jgi:hypothetical protein
MSSLPWRIIYYCLIVSLPLTSASVERSFSALKRVKPYSRNTVRSFIFIIRGAMSLKLYWQHRLYLDLNCQNNALKFNTKYEAAS